MLIRKKGSLILSCNKFSGETLLRQSISLLHVKDPLFKRMGASRLARYAIDGISHTFVACCP